MKINKTIFLTLLIAAGFHIACAEAKTSHASSAVPAKHDRKGLPEEMIISADELMKKPSQSVVVFDARSEKSYEESHLKGALLPLTPEYYQQENLYKKGIANRMPDADGALKENLQKYSKDMLIVTYCNSGGCQASAVLALQIKRLGFKNVKAMEDGIQTWTRKGYPVQSGG